MSETAAERPSIRQQQTDQTRQAIFAAAQHLFATRGYTETGIRDIATSANVNPALVTRYYGSKLQLFETTLEASLGVAIFTSAGRENFGEKIAEMLCHAEGEAAGVVPAFLLSAGDTAARESTLRLLKQHVIKPLEEWFGPCEAAERAAQLMLIVTGFFTYRLMLPLNPLKGDGTVAMREWLARTLQEIVDRHPVSD